MLAEYLFFLVCHFSQNHRATVARPSRDSRTTDARRSWERREAVDGNKCSQFHWANIVRVSSECRTNVARMSWNIRQWFVRQSYDIRATVANMSYSHIRCDRNVIMVAISYFCRQNMPQISLEIVVNCSHPSEILALVIRLAMLLRINR